MRFDVPTFGIGTIKTMVEAGASVLAVEARKTLFLDAEEAIAYADKHRISIVALLEEDIGDPALESELTAFANRRLAVGFASSTGSE